MSLSSPKLTTYQFSYSIYHRQFRQPLQTSHGIWKVRTGIIIQLTNDEGRSHPGEIAPIPWFGSESVEAAIEYCQQIGEHITSTQIHQISNTLPACQFGFGSALARFSSPVANLPATTSLSGLLPTGAAAIDAWQRLWAQGYSTLKWKIGVAPIAQEVAIWQQLIMVLPPTAKIRLDANGGLTYQTAAQWLQLCDSEPRIEFIEQPLAPDRILATIELAKHHLTPIALDESVATLDRLYQIYQLGWRGIYVIKPGIAGFPWRLRDLINEHQLDVVLSSVLETHVGRAAVWQLAAEITSRRAMGFGVDGFFEW